MEAMDDSARTLPLPLRLPLTRTRPLPLTLTLALPLPLTLTLALTLTLMEAMDDSAVLAELLPLLRATFAPALPALPPPLEVLTLTLTLSPNANPK